MDNFDQFDGPQFDGPPAPDLGGLPGADFGFDHNDDQPVDGHDQHDDLIDEPGDLDVAPGAIDPVEADPAPEVGGVLDDVADDAAPSPEHLELVDRARELGAPQSVLDAIAGADDALLGAIDDALGYDPVGRSTFFGLTFDIPMEEAVFGEELAAGAGPIDLAPVEELPVEELPVEADPIDAAPVGMDPVDPEPVDPEPVDAGPEPHPGVTDGGGVPPAAGTGDGPEIASPVVEGEPQADVDQSVVAGPVVTPAPTVAETPQPAVDVPPAEVPQAPAVFAQTMTETPSDAPTTTVPSGMAPPAGEMPPAPPAMGDLAEMPAGDFPTDDPTDLPTGGPTDLEPPNVDLDLPDADLLPPIDGPAEEQATELDTAGASDSDAAMLIIGIAGGAAAAAAGTQALAKRRRNDETPAS